MEASSRQGARVKVLVDGWAMYRRRKDSTSAVVGVLVQPAR